MDKCYCFDHRKHGQLWPWKPKELLLGWHCFKTTIRMLYIDIQPINQVITDYYNLKKKLYYSEEKLNLVVIVYIFAAVSLSE